MKKLITKLSYNIKYRNYNELFNEIKRNPYKNIEILEQEQSKAFVKMIEYVLKNVPYYQNKYADIGIKNGDIQSISDIYKLPILDKKIVKDQNEEFFSIEKRKYVISSSGGSTGVPLKYRLDKLTTMYGRAINDRGWGYAGYEPGDKIVIFAGGSLINKSNLKKQIILFLSNKKSFSSYGVDDNKFNEIYKYIIENEPKFMYCYASSIYFFSLYLEKNNLNVSSQIKGVFTTSEKLFKYQRDKIENYVGTVYDDYGLNDGGVSAHECEHHSGLHIDYERSILEVVDEEGIPIKSGKGRIIATDLRNYAMPLIRYDTGDIGEITYEPCACGRNTPRLTEIIGRTTDYLKLDDVYIGSPALTVLMGKLDLEIYQIVQETANHVVFNLVISNNQCSSYMNFCENHIKTSMKDKAPNADVDVVFYETISDLGIVNKHKFIINKTI